MNPRRKRPAESPSKDLDFDATQEIDPALVDSILTRSEPTLASGDFDDTEVMLDLDTPRKPVSRR